MEKLINEFSFGLFFWQLLIFIGLILILKKFAWKPILDTLNERENSIKESLESAQKAKEEARISTAAKEFADAQRQAVEDQRSKLASSLSGILGGATTEAEIDAQIGNINRFNFDNDIAKLKAAGPTEASMDMFTDFNKVAAPTVTGQAPANVAPISPSAFGGANQLVNTSGVSGASTGVASPFSGSSARIV